MRMIKVGHSGRKISLGNQDTFFLFLSLLALGFYYMQLKDPCDCASGCVEQRIGKNRVYSHSTRKRNLNPNGMEWVISIL